MKQSDYFKLSDLLREFGKEFEHPGFVSNRQSYEEYIKYNAIASSIDMIAELAEYRGEEVSKQ